MQALDRQSLLRSGRDLQLKTLNERAFVVGLLALPFGIETKAYHYQYECRGSTMKRDIKKPTMNPIQERRSFLKTLAFGLGTMAISDLEPVFAKKTPARKLKIGHTCITWATFPPKSGQDDTTLEPALTDISAQGFWSFETFPEVLDNWDQRGLVAPLIPKYGGPLRSAAIHRNLVDPSKRKDEIARITQLCKLVQKYQGTYIVLAPNGV